MYKRYVDLPMYKNYSGPYKKKLEQQNKDLDEAISWLNDNVVMKSDKTGDEKRWVNMAENMMSIMV